MPGLTRAVKDKAAALGFDACGITDLTPVPHGETLDRWLRDGMAGTMRYMHRQASKRKNPAAIAKDASRAVVVTKHYDSPDPPVRPGTGRVAKYARGPDYHDSIGRRLDELATFITEAHRGEYVARYYVDAGPVPERELGQRAGLGWIGKNTMLIDPARGSYSFIGAVLTNAPLEIDPPFDADRCGSCTRCLDACPTAAFAEPRVLDSRKCISYLTIEYRGAIDPDLTRAMGDWVFGCDVCQWVCPWNEKFSDPDAGRDLDLQSEHGCVDLRDVLRMSDTEFEATFGDTALTRSGLTGLQRNAAIALENEQADALAERSPPAGAG